MCINLEKPEKNNENILRMHDNSPEKKFDFF